MISLMYQHLFCVLQLVEDDTAALRSNAPLLFNHAHDNDSGATTGHLSFANRRITPDRHLSHH
jgi:hypothetical protein